MGILEASRQCGGGEIKAGKELAGPRLRGKRLQPTGRGSRPGLLSEEAGMGTEHRSSGQMTTVPGTSEKCLIECGQLKAPTDTGSRGGDSLSPSAHTEPQVWEPPIVPRHHPASQTFRFKALAKQILQVNALQNPKLGTRPIFEIFLFSKLVGLIRFPSHHEHSFVKDFPPHSHPLTTLLSSVVSGG